jgi:hypothetical protein
MKKMDNEKRTNEEIKNENRFDGLKSRKKSKTPENINGECMLQTFNGRNFLIKVINV